MYHTSLLRTKSLYFSIFLGLLISANHALRPVQISFHQGRWCARGWADQVSEVSCFKYSWVSGAIELMWSVVSTHRPWHMLSHDLRHRIWKLQVALPWATQVSLASGMFIPVSWNHRAVILPRTNSDTTFEAKKKESQHWLCFAEDGLKCIFWINHDEPMLAKGEWVQFSHRPIDWRILLSRQKDFRVAKVSHVCVVGVS